MFHQIGRRLGNHQGDPGSIGRSEIQLLGQLYSEASGFGHLAELHDGNTMHDPPYFHFTIRTRVPLPELDTISNSFDSRLAPPSPSPSPVPVVKPSSIARSTSGMPGPWSSKVSWSPRRLCCCSASRRTTPPPP